ncbi:uncharacterized protein LOC105183778 [Harpegnathos saltator]|uniref:uncharacterized protein LOC105183778 n=1 Tax=Harpegnathos saltator TaxID=610380 RepID=UPI0005910CE4|nr:uncharacterized protein LOC105183778 [Harpegnathos saltator]
MARLGSLFRLGSVLLLCSFAILTGLVFSVPSASTTDTPKIKDAARRIVDPFKSGNTENDPDCRWMHVDHLKDVDPHTEKEHTKDSHTSRFEEGSVEDARPSRHTGDRREGDVPRPSYLRETAVDLSLPDMSAVPGPISARTANQAEGRARDYGNPASSSIRNTPEDDVERRSIDSSRRRDANFEEDIELAEDRYRSQYPYWYQRQYPNQRYRVNDKRGPYRNYLRYPVFPGR